jgi:transposase
MQYHIRKVKTASKNIAIQIIKYVSRKRVIVKHIGTAHNNDEINILLSTARQWIEEQTKQISLFPQENQYISPEQLEYHGFQYTFLYETLYKLQTKLGYTSLDAKILNDLVTIRIIEPASKLRSLKLLEIYFNIKHRRQNRYKMIPKLIKLKNKVEKLTIKFAINQFGFDYSLVFYDVTTLYFETFKSDDLRKPGFSKDNKPNQPQILVGLVVSKEGFPLAYELFPGNTFEGHTLIPILKNLKKKHKIKNLTVVADAAMISAENIDKLREAKIDYIVGARLGNLQESLLSSIDNKLPRTDKANIRLKSKLGYLICDFSKKRFNKDKFEMKKQINKAKFFLQNPAKTKKIKFIKTTGAENQLNNELIAKTNILLGIKGYYTNLDDKTFSNQLVIERYHQLYKIEQAFRVSKHDLKTRPIFHFKEDPIRLHILICFMALAVSKFIEIKADISIRSFITLSKNITDAKLYNKVNNKIILKRVPLSNDLVSLLDTLEILPH